MFLLTFSSSAFVKIFSSFNCRVVMIAGSSLPVILRLSVQRFDNFLGCNYGNAIPPTMQKKEAFMIRLLPKKTDSIEALFVDIWINT